MITGIGAIRGIKISGIGNLRGININSGVHSSGGHRVSIIKKFGGKYRQVPYINEYIKEIAEENRCHTFVELTGGGGRTILNLPTFEIDGGIYKFGRKIYNEYDRGLCNLFNCVKDQSKVQQLKALLLNLGRDEGLYKYAIDNKSNENINELLSAAFTYMAAMLSWSGNCQKDGYLKGKTEEDARKIENDYFRKIKQLSKKSNALKDIEIINGSYEPLLIKYGADPRVVKYIDPPYHPITRHQAGLDIYDLEWEREDHQKLVSELLECRSWILSGYDPLVRGCEDYLPLEKAGAKKVSLGVFRSGTNSTETRKFNKEEYLWIMK